MKHFTTLLFTLITLAAAAQGTPQAKEILDKAAAKVKALPAAEVIFTLSMENPEEGIEETHNGHAWMKGNLYRLDLMDVENYYDGEVIYTYMPDVQEVNIKNPSDEEEGFLNPATLFDIHNQGFTQKLVSHTGGIAYIELTPTEEKGFSKIGIWVNTADSSIRKVTSFGKDGNQITISITRITPPSPLPSDAFFRFDTAAHPDVEVIDLR